MPDPRLERTQGDLVRWSVLEPEAPVRFTRRFRGALARAAATLQAAGEKEEARGARAIDKQVEVALGGFVGEEKAGPEHRRFVVAVQIASLPEAVRRVLGV